MFIACRCSRCHRPLRVRECYAGRTLHCPGCAAAVVIPAALPEPVRAVCSEVKTEAVREAKAAPAGAALSGRRVLPWLLLVPAALALGLLMWAGHGWTLASPLLSASHNTMPKTADSPLMTANWRHPPADFVRFGSAAKLAQFEVLRHRDRRRDLSPPPSLDDLKPEAVQLGDLLSVAVAPRGAAAFVTTADGLLKDFSYPKFQLRATYRLEQPAYRAVLDGRRSLLWTAACAPSNLRANRHGDQPLGHGDLHVYALPPFLQDQVETIPGLHPRFVLPVAGDVLELLISPDQQALFYLARTDDGVRLVRIDAERQVVDRQVGLAGDMRALCLTADGKTLYAAGKGKVHVFDPATLQSRRRVDVTADVYAIAADNDGGVYLAEQGQRTNLTRLDLRGPQPTVQQWSARLHGRIYVKLTPDQHHLYVGSSSVISDHLDSLLIQGHTWHTPLVMGMVLSNPQTPVQGEFFLTPDGSFLINRWGSVFQLAQGDAPLSLKTKTTN